MAKRVISSALLRVLQAVIGLIDRLELRFHVLTSRVFIGMILHGEPAISRLQRLVVRRPFDAEEFIIINFGSHAAPGQLRRSPLSVQESDDPKSLLTLFSLHPLPRIRRQPHPRQRSEEHTSELQSLMRISYAFFCLKKKT